MVREFIEPDISLLVFSGGPSCWVVYKNILIYPNVASLVQCELSDQNKQEKKATVPFILQMALESPSLLSTISADLDIITLDIIDQVFCFIEDWRKYFGSAKEFEDILMKLILRCDKGGIHIVKLLFECISTGYWSVHSKIVINLKQKCKELLETLLVELDSSIRSENPVNILGSFKQDIKEINQLLLRDDKNELMVASRLVGFIGCKDPLALIESIAFLLKNAKTPDQLVLLVKILTNELIIRTETPYGDKGGYLGVAFEQILNRDTQKFSSSNEEKDLSQLWKNLLTLLRWEKSNQAELLKCKLIWKALNPNLKALTLVFGSETSNANIIADLLYELEIPATQVPLAQNSQVLLVVTRTTVNNFFKCCTHQHSASRILEFSNIFTRLKEFCVYSKPAKVLALKQLLERALFSSDNVLFGAKNTETNTNEETEESLPEQNTENSKTIPLTKHSSVSNDGKIGGVKRKLVDTIELSSETISHNCAGVMTVIKGCCWLPDKLKNEYCDVSLESMAMLSVMLIQLLSPDDTYNGLPWPDEAFIQVTMERDLKIMKYFKTMPLLWDLLNFIATHRPSLCYCSVLLRALMGSSIHEWESMGDLDKSNATPQYYQLLETTIKLVDVMVLGQLLPPPLSMIRDVFPHVKAFEIMTILEDCVWSYLRDHVPSPALFIQDRNGVHWRNPANSKPLDIHTNSLKIIMQRNIKTLGDIFAKMFVNIPKMYDE